ncbi:MAG: peptidoglycan-associated lipoprotein Pal, partial [Flavobacteriia bacterium]|nr:peptidoglycan-associated lipoprotein Pal [Flavobacteriia bacterium]
GVSNVVYFDYDSYTVKSEFQSVLEAHARFIKADNSRRANIEGHTDERGGSEYNIALGQKRAEAVRRALNALGVADGQMEAVSYGKEKPAMSGNDENAFAKNRRAEITYR